MMLNLAGGLAGRGLRVDIVLARAEGAYLQSIPAGVKVVDLRSRRVCYCLPGLARYLRATSPRAVVSASKHANVVALCARALAQATSRLVITEHNTLSEFAAIDQTWRGRLLSRAMRWTYPLADSIVAVSHGVADDLAHSLPIDRNRINVIYNPVVTPALLAKAAEPLDHPWFKRGELPVILAVGRLSTQKDFATLLKAFARVRQHRPLRLVILGEGSERKEIEGLARELGVEKDVELPGSAENPYNYMKRARLLVLSSRWEGLGNVLIEAMAVGTQVVSTNCPSGPDEILEQGKWGKLVPVGDDKQMAAAICEILDGRVHYEGVERRASAFTLGTILDSYLEVMLPKDDPARELRPVH